MGGINHRPTKITPSTVEASAYLSQKVCEGFEAVLRANNALEDAMMVSVDSPNTENIKKPLGNAVEHLSNSIAILYKSIEKLEEIDNAYDHLMKVIKEVQYKGNPFASQISEFELKEKFSEQIILPYVQENIWNEVENHIKLDNLPKTFEWEKSLFPKLESHTRNLIKVLELCKEVAKEKGGWAFVREIEDNEIPLRQYYARVFSFWSYLHTLFLYSAVMSTELFYRKEENGTLGEVPEISELQSKYVTA